MSNSATVKSGLVSVEIHAIDAEQAETGDQGQGQPDLPCARLTLRRQAGRHDRNEDDVVDAEHDFERRQRQKARPGLGICEEFKHGASKTAPCRYCSFA